MSPAVLVVGAGVAGCAAAIALRRAGASCILVDAPRSPGLRVGETLRPSALVALARLGLADDFAELGAMPSHANVSYWGSSAPAVHNAMLDPLGTAWQIDRARFDAWLLAHALASGAELLADARLSTIERVAGGVRARVDDRTISARHVVDATGQRAAIARRLGARRLDYDHMIAWAAAAKGDASGDDDGQLLIETVPQGWWYSVALPSRELLAVFVTAAARREAWTRALAGAPNTARRWRGRPFAAGPRPFPIVVGRLDRAAGEGWIAAGDAAASCDPLASIGLAAALATGIRAAEVALADDAESRAGYCAEIDAAIEEHLALRPSFYAAERRWASSPFWRARAASPADAAITLDPAASLVVDAMRPRALPIELVGRLSPHEWTRLRTIATDAQPAHVLARAAASHPDNRAGDRRVIAALQVLVRAGVLRRYPSSASTVSGTSPSV